MKTYTVKQVSDMLKIPKDTLIYYDRLQMVQPQRGNNGYRYYSDQDISELKFVEVAKNNDFSLKEIQQYLECQRNPTIEGFEWQRENMQTKKGYLSNKLKDIQAMIDLLDIVDNLMERKVQSGYSDGDTLQVMINSTFESIRRNENEE